MIVTWGYGARGRREAMRQLAELPPQAGGGRGCARRCSRHDEAGRGRVRFRQYRFDEAERALDEARDERARARREQYAARQTHEQADTAVARLQRRVTELSERLYRLAELPGTCAIWIGLMF
jgi:uncharacterized protein (DUF3084 family)